MATPTTGTIPCPKPASFFTRRRWVPETAALRTSWLSVGPNATGLSRFPRISARRVGSFAVRAESCPDSYYVPEAKFYKVEAIVRPWRISQISAALLKIGIRGVTVSDVRGFGAQGGSTERQGGSEFSEDKFVAKIKMEIVVSKDQVEAVIEKIIDEARTGEIGDGKIFLTPVADIIRIRTGERGEKAERMMGGRSDVMASNN